MSKSNTSKPELIHVEKDGYAPRTFTQIQLDAMGKDPGGNSYDGWKVTTPVKEPKEATAAKAATAKAPKAATKTTNSDATLGKAESTGKGDDLDTKRTGSEDSSQGSEGDGKAD